jgi:hypothetical protein
MKSNVELKDLYPAIVIEDRREYLEGDLRENALKVASYHGKFRPPRVA